MVQTPTAYSSEAPRFHDAGFISKNNVKILIQATGNKGNIDKEAAILKHAVTSVKKERPIRMSALKYAGLNGSQNSDLRL